jgi:hypothetical protein
MGSRFGKYGDTKRKNLIRKNLLRQTVPQHSKKGVFPKRVRKSLVGAKIWTGDN